LTRLEELERAKVKLEALVRAAVDVEGNATSAEALLWADCYQLVDKCARALAHVYAAIEVEKRQAAGVPS
jgi:hypothetical protein